MNKFINKLEKKYGRYAVKNLIVYLLAAYAIGYILELLNPTAYSYLTLDPALVMQGQVWRLVTWVCTIPQDFSIFLIFMFMFQYYIGTILERNWGAFRYNCYIFSGIIFMTLSTMIIYWVTGISMSPSTYYINMASFLAFAACFPNIRVYFMMIIPIKIKWLAIVDLIYMGYEFIAIGQYKSLYESVYGAVGAEFATQLIWATRVSIIVSLLNFFIFYLSGIMKRYSPREVKRKVVYQKQVVRPVNTTVHKCAICGKTEKDGDDLMFRYCSKCNGNYEFCQEHLYTHKHFQ